MRQGDNARADCADCEAAAVPGGRRHSHGAAGAGAARCRRAPRHHRLGAVQRQRRRDRNRRIDLSEAIGRERFVASIDTKGGKVAVRGWKEKVDLTPEDAIRALEPYCGAFLYTHVDTEGTMQGFPVRARAGAARPHYASAHCGRRHSRAGGNRRAATQSGVDAVAGMAVYSGLLAA